MHQYSMENGPFILVQSDNSYELVDRKESPTMYYFRQELLPQIWAGI